MGFEFSPNQTLLGSLGQFNAANSNNNLLNQIQTSRFNSDIASQLDAYVRLLLGQEQNANTRYGIDTGADLTRGSQDIDRTRVGNELTLGQGALGNQKEQIGNELRLGEGKLGVDLAGINASTGLGYAGLNNQYDIAGLNADASKYGDTTRLQGQLDANAASRYGSDNSLMGMIQRAIADQNIAGTQANASRDVANIGNQVGLAQEAGKNSRFGSISGLLSGVLGGVLPQIFPGANINLPQSTQSSSQDAQLAEIKAMLDAQQKNRESDTATQLQSLFDNGIKQAPSAPPPGMLGGPQTGGAPPPPNFYPPQSPVSAIRSITARQPLQAPPPAKMGDIMPPAPVAATPAPPRSTTTQNGPATSVSFNGPGGMMDYRKELLAGLQKKGSLPPQPVRQPFATAEAFGRRV